MLPIRAGAIDGGVGGSLSDQPLSGRSGTPRPKSSCLDKIVFSSDMLQPGLNDRQRFLAWRELHNEHFGHTDLTPTEGPFEAQTAFAVTKDVVLARGDVTIEGSHHGGPHAPASDEALIAVIMNTSPGAYRMRQRGHDEVLNLGGTMLLSPVDDIHLTARERRVSWVMMVMPRESILRAAPGFEDLVGVPLQAGREALRMIAGYVGLIFKEGKFSDPLMDAHVSRTLIDLVSLAAGAEGDAASIARQGGLRTARLEAIVQAIAAGYANSAFSITVVAARLGLSPRYVQDLLQSTGSGFSERILERRLQHAVDLLTRPGGTDRKISDIALSSGFNDLSYFHRSFRRRFGVTPGGARPS